MLCACGCGNRIVAKPYHKWAGVPEFISGHNARTSRTGGQFVRGQSSWNAGLTKETHPSLMKISDSLKGKRPTEATRDKLRQVHLGKRPTEATRVKLSEARMGDKNPFYGKTHTRETRRKLSERNKACRGPSAYNWQGGITKDPYPEGWDLDLKKAIRIRDGCMCILCLTKKRSLDVHHIDYDKSNIEKPNLITLCHSCHMLTNGDREYWRELFRTLIGGR